MATTHGVVDRFKLISGTWTLAAIPSRAGAYPAAVAFGPDRQVLVGDFNIGPPTGGLVGSILNCGTDPDGHHLPGTVISGTQTQATDSYSLAADATGSIYDGA